MDTINSDFQQDNWDSQPACEPAAGKRVSPYADSPYVSYYEQNGQEHPNIARPGKVKKEKVEFDGERKPRRWLAVLLTMALVVGSCTATALIQNHFWQKKYDLLNSVTSNKLTAIQNQLDRMGTAHGSAGTVSASGVGLEPSQIYKNNVNAVVCIRSDISTGTGFIISEDGYIVSNYHVVEGGSVLQVITVDDKVYDAQLVGFDATNDVSLLKIEAVDLPYAVIGDSDALAVGDKVVAIGNALGELTSTLTVGYVSGKDRIVSTDGTAINMLQTDASINSGNSGGPLFNIYGEVIGITTAKYTGASSSGAAIEGIGFAIPINDVFSMIEDLRDYGYVTGPYLGVSVRDVDTAVIQGYGFPAGAYVVEIVEGLSADRAGIQPKDIITNVGGYNVNSVSTLTRVLRKFEAGDTTTVTVFRGGAEIHLEVTFDEKPQPETQSSGEATEPSAEYPWWFGYLPPFFGED